MPLFAPQLEAAVVLGYVPEPGRVQVRAELDLWVDAGIELAKQLQHDVAAERDERVRAAAGTAHAAGRVAAVQALGAGEP